MLGEASARLSQLEAEGRSRALEESHATHLFTWQTAGLLWQQVLIGAEQSRTGDHDGATDVHQVLTLLHSDTCSDQELLRF